MHMMWLSNCTIIEVDGEKIKVVREKEPTRESYFYVIRCYSVATGEEVPKPKSGTTIILPDGKEAILQ